MHSLLENFFLPPLVTDIEEAFSVRWAMPQKALCRRKLSPFYKNDPHNAVSNNIAIWRSNKSYIASEKYVSIRALYYYHFGA